MAGMGLKPIIALFLGLLIQLSQVQLCSSDVAAPPCATVPDSMACCDGLKSCHCAKDSDSDQKPAPLAVAAVDLKLLLSKVPETPCFAALISPPDDSVLGAASVSQVCGGYAGVPLSVAFCCFVI
jgi:hypothetical protein